VCVFFCVCVFLKVFIDIGDCLLIMTASSSYPCLLIPVLWRRGSPLPGPVSTNYFSN